MVHMSMHMLLTFYSMLTELNFTSKFQGYEYASAKPARDWVSAKDACAAAGATLAVITSPEEDKFLRIQFHGFQR